MLSGRYSHQGRIGCLAPRSSRFSAWGFAIIKRIPGWLGTSNSPRPHKKTFEGFRQKIKHALGLLFSQCRKTPFVGDVKRLKGQATAWRRRVGNYRIVYDLYIEEHLIVVGGILRRTSTTY
jgi:mRNA-degrading endonuclease RelE of RelBE toxin-antitoxin system